MTAVQYRVWTDPELADLLREDPPLVAIADALRESGLAAGRGGARRRPLRAAALVAAVCVGVALALVAPWSRSGRPGLADRALAALGTQPVLHVVVELPARSRLIDLKTGVSRPLREEKEIWFDRGRGLEHTVYRSGGAVVWNQLDTPKGTITAAGPSTFARPRPTIEPALQGFVDGYRQALASGAARQTATGKLGGVPVVWLSFRLARGDREDVAVDRQTGRPLLVRDCSGPCSSYRIKAIETVGLGAADFARPAESRSAKDDASGETNERTVSPVDLSALPNALPGAVWAGSPLDGLPLAAVVREDWRTTFGDGVRESWTGAELVYGSMSSETVPDFGRPFVQVWEAARPESAYLGPFPNFWLPPSGLDEGHLYVPWSGSPPAPEPPLAVNALVGVVHTNGVYVTIRASSADLLLSAARALTPIG